MADIQQFDKELAELKQFVGDLKADRAAQKEKEQREAWTKYTSMSLVFIAVLASVASQWSGKYGGTVLVSLNNSTYNQALASDQWSYYQAKSIKLNLYEALRELAPKTAESESSTNLASFKAKVQKYKADEEKITAEARKFEKDRDEARATAARANRLGGFMGSAISIFQIAIAVGSICLVTKKKPLWYLSLALAGAATFRMIQAWIS